MKCFLCRRVLFGKFILYKMLWKCTEVSYSRLHLKAYFYTGDEPSSGPSHLPSQFGAGCFPHRPCVQHCFRQVTHTSVPTRAGSWCFCISLRRLLLLLPSWGRHGQRQRSVLENVSVLILNFTFISPPTQKEQKLSCLWSSCAVVQWADCW